jgi:curved DNA-binding protein
MDSDRPFTDYYSILQVDPTCDAKDLESSFHSLAKSYHPDHTGMPDTAKFKEVLEAYKVLRSPYRRAQYDRAYTHNRKEEAPKFRTSHKPMIEEQSALMDADDHSRILAYLYDNRRKNAQNAGVVAYYLQEMLKCSDEHFEFHKWYLKEKGFIVVTEQGTLAITIQGVDHVIATATTSRAQKLLTGQSTEE